MSDTAKFPFGRRFWALLVGMSAANGAAAMAAYALLYGYFRWPDMLDDSLPFAGLEFLVILLLIAAANLSVLGRLYGFQAFEAPWLDRKSGLKLKVMAVGVASMLCGGLGTIHLFRALTDGVSIFDRGAGYFVSLLLTVAVIVLGTAPALVYGERKQRNSAGDRPNRATTPGPS